MGIRPDLQAMIKQLSQRPETSEFREGRTQIFENDSPDSIKFDLRDPVTNRSAIRSAIKMAARQRQIYSEVF